MNHLFPPLLPKESLQPPVLVLAAHPDDEVLGCGAMLAWHRAQGHRVVVAHMTDGAAGDPGGQHADIAAVRRAEGTEALSRLGVEEIRRLGLPDGQLPEHRSEMESLLRGLFEEIRPQTLYSFFFTESHRDHRALAAAVASVADALPDSCRCLLYGVNQVVAGGTMFETSEFVDQKYHAIEAYQSQIAYLDFRAKARHRDHSATVNVEDPAVQYAELFADLRPEEMPEMYELADKFFRRLLRDSE